MHQKGEGPTLFKIHFNGNFLGIFWRFKSILPSATVAESVDCFVAALEVLYRYFEALLYKILRIGMKACIHEFNHGGRQIPRFVEGSSTH